MREPLRVLIVEDSEADAELVLLELRRGGFEPQYQRVDTPTAMNSALTKQLWDIVISDYNMPKFSAPEALALLKQKNLDLPFIIVSGSIGEDLAVESVKNGAHDCIMKDNLARLLPAVRRELREMRVRYERKQASAAIRVRVTQQAAIAELGQEALQGISPDDLMNQTVDLVTKTLGVEYCEILEYMPENSTLLLRAGTGWKEGYVGKTTVGPGKESLAGYTFLTREPVVFQNLQEETRFQAPKLLIAHQINSGLSAIIPGADHPFGVLGAHTIKKRNFTKDDIYFMQAIAHILSSAILRKRAEDTLRHANMELEKSKVALQELATHDELTGLLNRREIMRILKIEMDRANRYNHTLSLLMMDLDHFKMVNDTYGHQAGDQVLRQFAMVIRQNIRTIDRAARYGGEEFLIILPEISTSGALDIASRLRSIVATHPFPLELENQTPTPLHISVSLGLASFPEDATILDVLISKSDQALYEAKTRGRNRVVRFNEVQSQDSSSL